MAGFLPLRWNSMSNYLVWHDISPVFELKIKTDCILDAVTGLAI